MGDDEKQSKSLAYRKNEQAIWDGKPPEKYLRLLPYIHGDTVLEIGSAEGVLALLLAEKGKFVIGLEKSQERHSAGLRLRERWHELGRQVAGCFMLNRDVRDLLIAAELRAQAKGSTLFSVDVDTVVAVRSIYYLREDAPAVMAKIHENGVKSVVLCGNRSRGAWSEAERMQNGLGKWNYYSSIEGMTELLTGAGYKIETVVEEGDPIVIGRHQNIA